MIEAIAQRVGAMDNRFLANRLNQPAALIPCQNLGVQARYFDPVFCVC